MKNTIKSIGRVALFLVILVVLLQITNKVFDPGYWFPSGWIQDRTARFAQLSLEEEGTLDVLNVGDSESLSAIIPMELWHDQGITSFNCGCDGMRLPECYTTLRTAFQKQKPKVVLLETGLLYRLDFDQDYQSLVAENIYYYFYGLRYHNMWKSFANQKGVRAYFKGYVVNNCIGVYEGPEDYMIETNEADQVTTRNKRFFKAIMNLCEREGVEVVLYSVPAPVNYNTYKHNGIQMLADEYGLKYIDFNMNWKEIGIDWSKDSQDRGDHLNRDGGIKLSTWLGNWLMDEFDLPDHRSDPELAEQWDYLYDYCEYTSDVLKGTNTGNVTEEMREKLTVDGDFRQPGYDR